jgi:succinate dehydrogenase / fumarate reductase membrane anchor subunit
VSGPAKFKNGVKISERHGAGEWTLEKVCLAILMPLGVWVASSAFTLPGAATTPSRLVRRPAERGPDR